MKRTKRPSRSRAHDFSALSTSIGVALTLALWGAMVVGAMVEGVMVAAEEATSRCTMIEIE